MAVEAGWRFLRSMETEWKFASRWWRVREIYSIYTLLVNCKSTGTCLTLTHRLALKMIIWREKYRERNIEREI